MPDIEQISADIQKEIGELASGLTEVRELVKKTNSASDVKEMEDRIVKKIAGQYQQAENEETRKYADEKFKEQSEAFQAEIDKLQTEIRRNGGTLETSVDKFMGEHRSQFTEYCIKADHGTSLEFAKTSEEYRELSEVVGPQGGFLLPKDMEAGIDKDIIEISPWRKYMGIKKTNTLTYSFIRRTGTPDGGWNGERNKSDESSSSYGEIEIGVHPCDVYTKASRDFIADVPGAESEIMSDAAEDLALLEATAFVSGTGVKQPNGFLVDSDVSTAADTTTGSVTAAAMITLSMALKDQYLPRAKFAFRRSTLETLLTLLDSNNNFLWNHQRGFVDGAPGTIAGVPWFLAAQMPAQAGGAFPVAIADWTLAYNIVDRSGIEVIRDPFTTKPIVEFLTRKRVGGRVRRAEAIKKMEV